MFSLITLSQAAKHLKPMENQANSRDFFMDITHGLIV